LAWPRKERRESLLKAKRYVRKRQRAKGSGESNA
jgi:hypothetical protein